ncbi:fatty acid synthase-like [Vanessa cardui]|uniref:fatty acid synthase-like n=1 Tax=Vanessa cardui TaxID=171605 RepID=UPI001F13DE59|nr:fatty acid synthase-like [Vanessa cardui]
MKPAIVSEDRLTSGHRLSHPKPGDEVLITGISGRFPDSDSVVHLQENLFNKVDLVSGDSRRWKLAHPEIPQRTGKINNINKFDASFFGVHFKQAHTMDPMCRILLEKTYEAIFDAGLNPNELRNTKTGVFIGTCFSESEKAWLYDKAEINQFGISGCSKAMLANRISSWLEVTGPSYTIDSGCSGSLYALDQAFKAIHEGHCDTAIVGGSNLCLHPYVSLHFYRLGALSADGRCKTFDNSANGYVRSEAIVVCFLQRAKDSRRVYAQVLYTKTNCDGYKEQGITYPSCDAQKLLLREFYEECSVSTTDVEFIDAHGTGTKAGDPVELTSLGEILCTGRSEPLMIGSIKTNLGHGEPTAGLCSLAKLCIAYTTGYIAPNLNYKVPREEASFLVEGKLKVVTEKQPWVRGLFGINSFGFGGANAHILLKNFARPKVNNGIPSDDLPRLVCVSGRTEAAVAKILDDLESRTVDAELVRLLHAIHDKDITGHGVRGYTLLESSPTRSVSLARNIQNFSGARRPVWFVYSGEDSKWAGMATQLMRIPVFADAIEKCHKKLEPKGIDLIKVITDSDHKINSILNSFIAVAAVQIGLTDVLKAVGIEPDYIIGHGLGDFGCAYAGGSFTTEQVILSAYHEGLTKTPFIKSSMADLIDGYNDSQVLFEEKVQRITDNAITIEITPNSLLQAFLRRSIKKDIINISLTKRNHRDNVEVLLTALGRLYGAGLNPHLANIYPTIKLPVSQGTPMLSHLVEWEHSEDWYVMSYRAQDKINSTERTVTVSITNENCDYMVGHIVDGRNLYPATGYIVMVWETLGMMMGQLFTEVSVVFEDVRFQRATNIPKNGDLEFTVMIQRGSGHFEIVESGASIVTGRIYAKKNVGQDYRVLPAEPEATGPNVKHLLTKDFYKELRLRGYQYRGLFRGVIRCNVEYTRGRLIWADNWVTFMDSMMQMRIIGEDTRRLYVPTRIEKLCIDSDMHYDAISKMNTDSARPSFEISVYRNADVIRSGGVEIRGFHATPISRRIPIGAPVLERNVFIPNMGRSTMKIEEVLRSNIQLIIENMHTYKVKISEIVDDEYNNSGFEPIRNKIADIVCYLPLVQADISVISEKKLKVVRGNDNLILIGINILQRPHVIKNASKAVNDKGFIISREKKPIDPKEFSDIYDIITMQNTGLEWIVLFRKRVGTKATKFNKVISSDQTFAWIDKVKEELKNGEKVVLYSQDEETNGLLGLINCLRKEPGGGIFHGLLIADSSAPPFDPELALYKKQLEMDLAVNVYQKSQWGTYRHMLLDNVNAVKAHHALVNTVNIGDLSSVSWLEGPIRENSVFKDPENYLMHIYCAALNFRDVIMAMGRVTVDAVARGRLEQECVQGFEIVGKTCNGTRVMSLVKNSGLANIVVGDRTLSWGIPDEWTFEEAATVPVAYTTVYYALVMVGKIQRGESILIHAGSGGVGQAAINVALSFGCEVFTTVGTEEKRLFIKKLYPQLKDSHIGNSRDTSFEDMIRKETNGRGVDLVLNSLSDERLQASMRCLGYRGRFLEIGKFDINNNEPIGVHNFHNEISFHGIMLDYVLNQGYEFRKNLRDLLLSGIQNGVVRPLTHCTFEKHQIEAAFRYMAAGKHIGKVIIKIRDEERSNRVTKPQNISIEAVPRYMCHEDLVYILVGGLGGFGLELADWLIVRGARKVLLTSRRGISDGYQASRMRAWAGYGADVQISMHDVTTEEGCEQMLKIANSMGTVEAIFNLAVILKNSLFENQTPESFKASFAPKALATIYLDKLSKKLCPKLKNFVIFSSVSCGRGNIGQTNYGFSNSVMERLCESRKKIGLPALAVQWGTIGDVGLVADMQDGEEIQLEFCGTFQQSISSCLQALDKFLKQDDVVVSSIVVAKKKIGCYGYGGIVESIAQILGIKDLKKVSHRVSLPELGMDSMMAVEIKQTLQREFEIVLSTPDIRTLTFGRLKALAAQKEAKASTSVSAHITRSEDRPDLRVLMGCFGDENLALKPFIYMPSMVSHSETMTDVSVHDQELIMFILPGLEGCAAGMAPLCSKLKMKTCVLQFGNAEKDTLNSLVNRLHKTIKSLLTPGSPFVLLGYSFGTLPTLKLASILESEGHDGTIICLDGSPDYLYRMLASSTSVKSDKQLQNSLITQIVDIIAPKNKDSNTLIEKLKGIESYDDRITYALKASPPQQKYSENFIKSIGNSSFDRLKMILNQAELKKIRAPITLLRPKENPPFLVIKENYGLDKLTEGQVSVHLVECNHEGIIENTDAANIINKVFAAQERGNIDKLAITSRIKKQLSVGI